MRPIPRSLATLHDQSLLQIGLLCLLGITIALVAVYVLSEQTIYWWDYTTYQRLLDEKELAFRASPLRSLFLTWRSAGSDYSDYPLLLLLQFGLAFRDSRFVYILSVSLVYLVPFILGLASIATGLIPTFSMRVDAVDRQSRILDTAQQNYSPVRSTDFSIPILT